MGVRRCGVMLVLRVRDVFLEKFLMWLFLSELIVYW